ncbi:MAG TPA: protease inhibitor I42 family protein [Candidatus Baltobacteraceae bacterium]
MNTRLLTIALALAVLFGVFAPDIAPAQGLSIFTISTHAIRVKTGSYFLIELASNPTTGYNWSLKGFSHPGVVQALGSGYAPSTSGRMGAGGTYGGQFKAIRPGTTTLTLAYARSFEPGSATMQTFEVTVTP